MSHETTNWAALTRSVRKKRPKWLWKLTDGHCAYCGIQFTSPSEMTVDHLTPRSLGGGNEKANRFPCCRSCNSTKLNRPLSYLRDALHRKATGAPRFSDIQIAYLRSFGIELPTTEPYLFYWERLGNEFGPEHG